MKDVLSVFSNTFGSVATVGAVPQVLVDSEYGDFFTAFVFSLIVGFLGKLPAFF